MNTSFRKGLKSIIREDIKRFYAKNANAKGTVKFEKKYNLGETKLEVSAWDDGNVLFVCHMGNCEYYRIEIKDYLLEEWDKIWAAYRRRLKKIEKENLENDYVDEGLKTFMEGLNNY